MEKITQVTEADNGRVAVSQDGYFRIRIVEGRGDSSKVEFLKDTGSWVQGHISEGFGLVHGSREMFWEGSTAEEKSKINIWFETEPASFTYGLDVVKNVLAEAFRLTSDGTWGSFEEYLSEFGENLQDKDHVNGVNSDGDFDGCSNNTIGTLLSFEEFAERLGIQIEGKSVEQDVPVRTPQTPFEIWCDENGYDPTGKFVFDKEKTGPKHLNCMFSVGDLMQLIEDDGTTCPKFINQNGSTGYEEFDSPGRILMKPKRKSVAKPRYRKPRQKPVVRQKTDVTIVYKTGQRYTIKGVDGVALNDQFISIGVSKKVNEGIRTNSTNVINKDLVKNFLVIAPEGEYAIINCEQHWLVNSPKGFAIVSQWCYSF